jgi:tRNA 2-thiocytidine biosynthesis protein TtcA
MFRAMGQIVPSHMLDKQLFPFTSIKATGAPFAGGDIAFDEDEEACGPVEVKPSVIRIHGDAGPSQGAMPPLGGGLGEAKAWGHKDSEVV